MFLNSLSRRSSPRKAALNARSAAAAQGMSDDDDDDIREIVTERKTVATKSPDVKKVAAKVSVVRKDVPKPAEVKKDAPKAVDVRKVYASDDDDDSSSSDSIMELEAEDPLADPLSSDHHPVPEKTKSSNGGKVMTIDNVKDIQSLASQQARVTLIDPR